MKEKIIKVLSNQDKQSLTITEINDELHLETIEEYQKLQNTLEEMTSDGIIYYSEKKKKYLLLSNSHLLKGKFLMYSKGFGFVEIDKNSKDVYISESNVKDARNNDIVVFLSKIFSKVKFIKGKHLK